MSNTITLATGHVVEAVLVADIPVRITGLSHEDNTNDPMLHITLCESLTDVAEYCQDISNRSGYRCEQWDSKTIHFVTGYTTFWLRIYMEDN